MINATLFNSESWHGVTKEEIRQLEVVDHFLLRSICGAHAKVPVEHLYLETGALPISDVIRARRLIYLQTILNRSEQELTRRVYTAQKKNPSRGDWTELIKEDMEAIGVKLNDEEIAQMGSYDYKKLIKSKVREATFRKLEELKKSHTKVEDNVYQNLKKPQEYILSEQITNEETELLFALRSRTVRGIRENFPYLQYGWGCESVSTVSSAWRLSGTCAGVRSN